MLTIERRCQLSKILDEFLIDLFSEFNAEEKEHMENLLCEWYREDKMEEEEKMNYEQAKVFRETIIPFGLHRGSKIGEVPLDYLIWISDQTEWHRKVQRYIRYEQGLQG